VPVRAPRDQQRHFAVVFEESSGRAVAPKSAGRGRARNTPEVTRLREELEATKEYVSSLSSQHASASEELGVVNEELQSTNEELQSTNEELQTAKEELQSSNEELETVNEELQRGNERLRESNDDLVNVLDSVDIAIIIVDIAHKVRRFTPSARTVMRLLPSDLGRPIGDLQPVVPMPELAEAIASAIGSLAIHDSEIRAADGMCFRMQVRPYRTADLRIDGAVITFVDISELRRSIDTARTARDFAATVVETVPSPLAVIDASLHVNLANHAFVAAFDGTGSPANRSLMELGEGFTDGLGARLRGLFADDRPIVELELTHRGAALLARSYVLEARRIPTTNGTPLVLVGLADVTARKQLEHERDAFFAGLSDELRTPLSAILLWVDVLRGLDRDDPRRGTAIETIRDAANLEVRLVDDLLELVLSRRGELVVESTPVRLERAVEAALEIVRGEADAKHLQLLADLVPCKIIGDARRLQQIAMKLLANAVKFTAEGGAVRVSLGMVAGAVQLEVRDTGPGIAPEFLTQVFEPFSQEDRSATRSHRGLGVGLAIVRHLVERQHGTITVASTVGLGTTFTVRFAAA
ncbi:MAG: ATP-binding protein, partial [Kofleriaceae bacterium]